MSMSRSSKLWRLRTLRWLSTHEAPESGAFLFIAMGVGVGAGLGAVLFRLMIEGIHFLAYESWEPLFDSITPFHLIIIPALGGLIIGPLIYRFAREAKGHGVPEVMEAVALRGGRIRPPVVIIKSIASSICIATGGSVGREGPIAQIGAAIGSTIGQWLNLSDDRIRTLVACGAAGGVAATFNAPIAGAIFALEVILGKLSSVYFGAVVISAVTADVIAHAFEGNLRTFSIPEYTLNSSWELLLYAILGVFAALAAVSFTRLLYFSEDLWDKIRIPEYYKPMFGGALLGVLGIITYKIDGMPRIFGVGYDSITEALFGGLPFLLVISLLFLKMLATMITLGSGGSGGVFAPSLFMGAMLGGSFGYAVNLIFPGLGVSPGAYALVGMAAFFSGAAHAPITAILILFEMTGNYNIILPLMLATVISTLISRMISTDSIYTLKLSRRGIQLNQGGEDVDVMESVTVGEVMTKHMDTTRLDMPLKELLEEFTRTHHHGFPVVNDDNELVGVVTIRDLENAMNIGPIDNSTVKDIATTKGLMVTYPYEAMWMALQLLADHNIGRLPVVEEEGSSKLVGMVRRIDIINAYNKAIANKAKARHKSDLVRLDKLDNANLVNIKITSTSPVLGQQVKDINLTENCLIVSVRRGRKLHIAHGHTVLQKGDLVTVFSNKRYVHQVQKTLTGTSLEKTDRRDPASQHSAKKDTPERRVRYREVFIPGGARSVGMKIRDLSFPSDCILVSIHRDNEVIMPQGNTTLHAGDHVEIFGVEDQLDEAELRLKTI